MQEMSTYVKMGVAMLILTSVLITTFCLWGVAQIATTEYYQEQITVANDVKADLGDLFNARIPIIQLCTQMSETTYGLNLHQIVIHAPVRTNGKLTSRSTRTYTDIDKCVKDWSSKTGYLEDVVQTPAKTYIIYIRVGD